LSRICPGWLSPQPGTTGKDQGQPDGRKLQVARRLRLKQRVGKELRKKPVPNPSLCSIPLANTIRGGGRRKPAQT
jgi:hypothetical protein